MVDSFVFTGEFEDPFDEFFVEKVIVNRAISKGEFELVFLGY